MDWAFVLYGAMSSLLGVFFGLMIQSYRNTPKSDSGTTVSSDTSTASPLILAHLEKLDAGDLVMVRDVVYRVELMSETFENASFGYEHGHSIELRGI